MIDLILPFKLPTVTDPADLSSVTSSFAIVTIGTTGAQALVFRNGRSAQAPSVTVTDTTNAQDITITLPVKWDFISVPTTVAGPA